MFNYLRRSLAVVAVACAAMLASHAPVQSQGLQNFVLPDGTAQLGHLNNGGGLVTGTGCTIAAGSTDFSGRCVTSATSGSIAFSRAYAAAPFCLIQDGTATPVTVYTTTTTQITLTSVTSAHTLYWICIGPVGG